MIQGDVSQWIDITSGTLLGSVLGLILFLVYSKDLPGAINGLIKVFADDAKIYYAIDSIDTPLLMQDNLNRAKLWAKLWDMILNNNKCHHTHVGENSEVCKYEMGSGYKDWNSKSEIRERLRSNYRRKTKIFKEHIIQKVNTETSVLYSGHSHTWTKKCSWTSTNQWSILEYATQIWSPQYKKDKIILENVQRQETPLVKCVQHAWQVENVSLENEQIRYKCTKYYTLLKKKIKKSFFKWHLIRQPEDIPLKWRSRLNVRANYFSQPVIDQWNTFPESIATAPSLNATLPLTKLSSSGLIGAYGSILPSSISSSLCCLAIMNCVRSSDDLCSLVNTLNEKCFKWKKSIIIICSYSFISIGINSVLHCGCFSTLLNCNLIVSHWAV